LERRGTYCLVFKIDSITFSVRSGKRFKLQDGYYIYVGSAFGSGGIDRRVERHLRREKKKHWHIDYITTDDSFKAIEVLKFYGVQAECQIASFLNSFGEPVLGFGASDCSCPSHLFKVDSPREAVKRIKTFVQHFSKIC